MTSSGFLSLIETTDDVQRFRVSGISKRSLGTLWKLEMDMPSPQADPRLDQLTLWSALSKMKDQSVKLFTKSEEEKEEWDAQIDLIASKLSSSSLALKKKVEVSIR